MKLVNIIGDPTVGASRLLSPDKGAFAMTYFQGSRPFLPSEVNLAQLSQQESRRLLAQGTSRPGFFLKDALTLSGLNLVIPVDRAVVNGEVVRVESDSGTTFNRSLSDRPVSGNSWDIVFLEVWYQEVSATGTSDTASKYIYPNGWVDSPTELSADPSFVIRDPSATSVPETSRRIQLRWRIRAFNTTVDPTTTDGLTTAGLAAQGGAISAQLGYTFSALSGALNTGLYQAGDGTLTAAGLLKDALGYVWALPLAVVSHASTDTPGTILIGQVTDKRRNASPLANFGANGNNATISGDDIIFYKLDGTTEMGRVIGTGISGGGNFKVRSAVLESTTTTAPPLVVASTQLVANLNVSQLASRSAGNANGNIPINNGTVNTNLNAQYVNGFTAVANGANSLLILDGSALVPSANLPALGLAAQATAVYDSRTSTYVGGATFYRTTDTVANATNASNAALATLATNATRATTAGTIDNQTNSATTVASVPATASQIVLRDGNGDINIRYANATRFIGLADNSTLFDSVSLGMPSSYPLMVLGANGWGTANDTTGWSYPTMKGTTGGRLWSGWGRFPFRPSEFLKASGKVLKCKVFGGIMRPGLNTDGDPGAAVYGFRIITGSGTTVMSIERTLDPANSATADSYRIEDYVAEFDVTGAMLDDSVWHVEIRNSMAGTASAGEFYNSDIHLIFRAA